MFDRQKNNIVIECNGHITGIQFKVINTKLLS